ALKLKRQSIGNCLRYSVPFPPLRHPPGRQVFISSDNVCAHGGLINPFLETVRQAACQTPGPGPNLHLSWNVSPVNDLIVRGHKTINSNSRDSRAPYPT